MGPAHFPAETTRPLGQGCLPFSPYFECCRYAQNLTKYNLKIFQVRIARFYIRLLKDFERSDHCAEVVCHFHLLLITWIITITHEFFMNDYFWVRKSLKTRLTLKWRKPPVFDFSNAFVAPIVALERKNGVVSRWFTRIVPFWNEPRFSIFSNFSNIKSSNNVLLARVIFNINIIYNI